MVANNLSQSSEYTGSDGHSKTKVNFAFSRVLNFVLKFLLGLHASLYSFTLPIEIAASVV